MTSALLFVALLALVDLSYRRWMRHSISRRMNTSVDLEEREAAIIPMPARDRPARDLDLEASGRRDERQSS